MAEKKLDINVKDLEEDMVVGAMVDEQKFAVVKHGGMVSILDAKCTHEGGPLNEGYIDNGELICPWHSGAYDIATGKADENTPWVTDVKSYKARVDNATGDIYVEVV